MRLDPTDMIGLPDISRRRSADPARPTTLLVFDSGLGGLTVHREIARLIPDARYVYCADDAAFPYGGLTETALVDRVVKVVGRQIERFAPDCVVIACNTASTLVMPTLRARFPLPFVGTVPAIKPACARSRSRMVSVLATPGTVKREYTRRLIADFAADCEVTLVGSSTLAALAEATLRGEPVDDAAIAREIAPCFVETARARTDAVALGCTHYPLIVDAFRRLAPWPVAWIDPAPAIARRVCEVSGVDPSGGPASGEGVAVLTGGSARDALTPVFARFGLAATHVDPLPLH